MIQHQPSIVIMGVAGCGKSSLGAAVAQRIGFKLIEGDEYHIPQSLSKMRQGIALTDIDRDGWLASLANALQTQPGSIVLTCSALKRIYRDRLRQAATGLRFVFLDISLEQAQARVTERAATHFFSTSLVDSQFATLESPVGEHGVLRIDAVEPLAQLEGEVCKWINAQNTQNKVVREPA